MLDRLPVWCKQLIFELFVFILQAGLVVELVFNQHIHRIVLLLSLELVGSRCWSFSKRGDWFSSDGVVMFENKECVSQFSHNFSLFSFSLLCALSYGLARGG
jgi:hypothetical protein